VRYLNTAILALLAWQVARIDGPAAHARHHRVRNMSTMHATVAG
jgi:hypothetical protein